MNHNSCDLAARIRKCSIIEECLQVFIHTKNLSTVRDVCVELSKILHPGGTPLVFLSGEQWTEHRWLWGGAEAAPNPVPLDRPVVLVIENFGVVPTTMQRSYAHLADGENRENGLHVGSVLVLHVREADHSGIEPGTLDRGLWFRLEETAV